MGLHVIVGRPDVLSESGLVCRSRGRAGREHDSRYQPTGDSPDRDESRERCAATSNSAPAEGSLVQCRIAVWPRFIVLIGVFTPLRGSANCGRCTLPCWKSGAETNGRVASRFVNDKRTHMVPLWNTPRKQSFGAARNIRLRHDASIGSGGVRPIVWEPEVPLSAFFEIT
jgi:hypothetical protein